MTSAQFELIPISSIIVERGARQRKSLDTSVAKLKESIAKLGLIHPPVVTRECVLVAGESRLEACKQLGWLEIPVQYADEIDPLMLHLLELEENIKRTDLSWQEETAAVEAYHELQKQINPGWSAQKTAESLGVTHTTVNKQLEVARAIKSQVPGVADADKFSTAHGITARKNERIKASATLELPTVDLMAPTISVDTKPLVKRRANLLNMSFLDFQSELPFNFIHCDFPYGVNIGDKKGQSAAKETGTYEDTPEVYFELLDGLGKLNCIAESAHLMFWFSMDFYTETKKILEAQGWRVNPFPLIWYKSDNSGILPDKDRGPRRIYETAFIASRGDRLIVRPTSNVVASPVTREFHTSEKPFAMLSNFFRMFVDETTVMLDPTAGSANSVKAAETLGAQFSLGLEINTEFWENGKRNLQL